MGSANKTTNLGLPQWLGNEYFERTDMNDAFKAIDDAQGTTTEAIASAKTELNSAITAAKSEAATNLDSAKTELNSAITAAKSEAATNLASAKTELENSISALGSKVKGLWCAMLEEGYNYTCTIEEDYSTSTAGLTSYGATADLYCSELLGTAAGAQKGVKETYVFNADTEGASVSYDTIIEKYTLEGTAARTYTMTANAGGNWSGVWS